MDGLPRQSAERVFRRALILGFVAQWGMNYTLAGRAGADLNAWSSALVEHDLLDELTEEEHVLTEVLTTESFSRHQGNLASYYCEGLAMCLFLFGLDESPPVSDDITPLRKVSRMMFPIPNREDLTLASPEVCWREFRKWFWIHRRLYAFFHGHQRCDLHAWIARTPGFENGVEGLDFAEGDLAVFDGEPLFRQEPDCFPHGRGYLDSTRWRLRVLRWVCSPGKSFGDVLASPYSLQDEGGIGEELYAPNAPEAPQGVGLGPRGGRRLHWAASLGHLQVLQELVKDHQELESLDIHGETALHCALRGQSEEAVRLLLEAGAGNRVNSVLGAVHTPFRLALRQGNLKLITALFARNFHKEERPESEEERLAYDCEVLTQAIHQNHEPLVHLLLAHGYRPSAPNRASSPLHCAVVKGESMVRALLEVAVDLEHRDGALQTPLLLALQEDQRGVVDVLLEAGADCRAVDAREQSALHWASCRGNLRHVRVFVERGVPLAAVSATGFTPFALAVQHEYTSCALALLEKGADPNAPLGDGTMALITAAHHGDLALVEGLLAHGAEVNVTDSSDFTPLIGAIVSRSPEIVQVLFAHGADPSQGNADGQLPLAFASHTGQLSLVKNLVEHGADIDAFAPVDGITALMTAVMGKRKDVVQFYLSQGVVLNTANNKGETALHFAAIVSHELASLLVEAGADPTRKDHKGNTPLDWATRRKVHKSIALLRALS